MIKRAPVVRQLTNGGKSFPSLWMTLLASQIFTTVQGALPRMVSKTRKPGMWVAKIIDMENAGQGFPML
jgi:hypothetical protein